MTAPRVVSLLPSATETLLALGVAPVACTRFCKVPGIATVGGTKDPDLAAVAALRPDLVIVNDEENRRQDADALVALGLTLHSMSPRAVDDVGAEVVRLAEVVGAPVPAPFAEPAWSAWLDAWRARRPVPAVPAFVPVWRRPWMSLSADTYGSSLLELLGVANVFAGREERYPEVTLEEAAGLGPALALLPTEPYPFGDRHVPEVAAALPGARVAVVEGEDLFWWGVRTLDAAARLEAALAEIIGSRRAGAPGPRGAGRRA